MNIILIVLSAYLSMAQVPEIAFDVKVKSQQFEFTPAPGHHFNDKAPNKVEFEQENKKEKAVLKFSKEKIEVMRPLLKQCEVTAQLYVCDEKETYCVPRKHKYKCSNGELIKGGSGLKTNSEFKIDTKKKDLFYVNSSSAAFKDAAKNKKLLLIDFFGIWCPPCNMLDETIFNTPEFKKYKKDYVFLKMDADLELSWDLKSKYKVTGYPTVILARSNGDEILRIIGSRKKNQFLQIMQSALEWKNLNNDEIKVLLVKQEEEKLEVKELEKVLEEKNYEKVISIASQIVNNQKLLNLSEWSKADLYAVIANAYEELKNEEQKKLYYKKAFEEYTMLIKEAKLNEKTERGFNLERIYCLWKSGDYLNAKTYYENLEKIYPNEFTFYYQHAHMLKEQKMHLLALEKANQAFIHSYGDNKLRVTNLIAELQIELGQKEKALSVLSEVINNFTLPEDKTIRSHRYFDKLVKLKETLN